MGMIHADESASSEQWQDQIENSRLTLDEK